MIFQSNKVLLSTGENIDLWSISLTSFTCLYTAVTAKIWIWTRWWTKVTFFFYTVMSILVYIAYVWFSDLWSESRMRHSIVAIHQSPLFYLSVLLCGGFLFLVDLALEYYRFEFHKTGSDYVRLLMETKLNKGFNDIDTEVQITEEDLDDL